VQRRLVKSAWLVSWCAWQTLLTNCYHTWYVSYFLLRIKFKWIYLSQIKEDEVGGLCSTHAREESLKGTDKANKVWGCELDSTGSGYGPVAGCCECGNELSGSSWHLMRTSVTKQLIVSTQQGREWRIQNIIRSPSQDDISGTGLSHRESFETNLISWPFLPSSLYSSLFFYGVAQCGIWISRVANHSACSCLPVFFVRPFLSLVLLMFAVPFLLCLCTSSPSDTGCQRAEHDAHDSLFLCSCSHARFRQLSRTR
jgi:hypothetical protein